MINVAITFYSFVAVYIFLVTLPNRYKWKGVPESIPEIIFACVIWPIVMMAAIYKYKNRPFK